MTGIDLSAPDRGLDLSAPDRGIQIGRDPLLLDRFAGSAGTLLGDGTGGTKAPDIDVVGNGWVQGAATGECELDGNGAMIFDHQGVNGGAWVDIDEDTFRAVFETRENLAGTNTNWFVGGRMTDEDDWLGCWFFTGNTADGVALARSTAGTRVTYTVFNHTGKFLDSFTEVTLEILPNGNGRIQIPSVSYDSGELALGGFHAGVNNFGFSGISALPDLVRNLRVYNR